MQNEFSEKVYGKLVLQKGDLVTGDYHVFCQQVNCRGVMRAGLAAQIASAYPEVLREEKFLYRTGMATLGSNLYVHTKDKRICVNMHAQDGYGRDKRYTNYFAFHQCLDSLSGFLKNYPERFVVGFPYGIGCGLAGGDWYIILGLLKDFAETVKQKVVIVSLR